MEGEWRNVILKNGLVDLGEGEFERADVVIDGGRIGAVGRDAAQPAGAEVLDCRRFAVLGNGQRALPLQ